MIDASEKWKETHKQPLLPETNVEITFRVATGQEQIAEVIGQNESDYSAAHLIKQDYYSSSGYLATLEPNVWLLDGGAIVADSGMGYMAPEGASAGVTISLFEESNTIIPGITVVWSASAQEGCATEFTVTAKRGGEIVATTTVYNNTERISVVDMDVESYDSFEVEIHKWSLPLLQKRIWRILLGHIRVYDKSDILSFEHVQQGHPNTGEIPQVSVRFALDNREEQWNILNPVGSTKYLAERLQIDVRYGLLIDGLMEWVSAGSFFLSEWTTPSNGLEASFVAKRELDFLMNDTYTSTPGDTLYSMVLSAAVEADAGLAEFPIEVDSVLQQYSSVVPEETMTRAVVIQMCANAARCLIRPTRSNTVIEPVAEQELAYTIPLALSYSHPEVELSKPLKAVSVLYANEQTYVLPVSSSGETQTVENGFITTEEQADRVAWWVAYSLMHRKTVKGEFRADPRLDLFDIVTVESKYGTIYPVLITYIKYIYEGSFKATYEGRVIEITGGGAVG